jgi:GNAT superfamily N-acetyltransferase
MTMRFAVITDDAIVDFIEQIKPLLELHYEEITLDKDVIKLKPNWERYLRLSHMDKLATLAAYDDDKLVGYSIFFLEEHIHYEDNIIARNDVLFLHPEYRKGMTGIKLIKASEDMLSNMGVSKIFWHIKYSRDFRSILYRMGYKDEDIILGKALRGA